MTQVLLSLGDADVDEFGNYWLSREHKAGPAIFPHKAKRNGRVERTGTYTALLSPDQGFIVEPGTAGDRAHFPSVEAAWTAIRRILQAPKRERA